MVDENYIIDRIEKLCEEKQLSRYRLAQKAGIAQSSLSTLLNRKSMPTIQTLEKICVGLDITLAQFFAGDNMTPDLTLEQKELLDTWNDMDEQERALVKAYIKGIIRT
ncbi:MAG: helix-turn-helix transcriptional regulator [Lachnospiraceae bacterium]|nr:helix-turn-helix transcriptional regulator [Lachnospiraceae bacterium]